MGLSHSPRIVTDELVLCLDAANPKSYPGTGTTWYDLSGNNNNATLNGTNTYGAYNSAGYFTHAPSDAYFGAPDGVTAAPDAAGAWWVVPHSSELTPVNGWTVSGFMYVNGVQSGNDGGFFHKAGVDERAIKIAPISSNIRIPDSTNWSAIVTNISAHHNAWAHYTVTYNLPSGTYGTDMGTAILYINGSPVTSNATHIPAIDTGKPIWLGRRNGHLKHFLDASLSNYQYYTKALTSTEVLQNFTAYRGRFGI